MKNILFKNLKKTKTIIHKQLHVTNCDLSVRPVWCIQQHPPGVYTHCPDTPGSHHPHCIEGLLGEPVLTVGCHPSGKPHLSEDDIIATSVQEIKKNIKTVNAVLYKSLLRENVNDSTIGIISKQWCVRCWVKGLSDQYAPITLAACTLLLFLRLANEAA